MGTESVPKMSENFPTLTSRSTRDYIEFSLHQHLYIYIYIHNYNFTHTYVSIYIHIQTYKHTNIADHMYTQFLIYTKFQLRQTFRNARILSWAVSLDLRTF